MIKALGLSAFSPIWLLTHPDLRRAPWLRAFMSHMAKAFAARRADFFGRNGS